MKTNFNRDTVYSLAKRRRAEILAANEIYNQIKELILSRAAEGFMYMSFAWELFPEVDWATKVLIIDELTSLGFHACNTGSFLEINLRK